MRILENLEPKKVFYYFEEICNIPHGSTNLDGISSYLEQFAKDRGLECIRDKSNNIIIIKEATKGYENAEPIIIQGHMDMVAVHDSDCDIDMASEPLRLKVDGDFVYAEGTSLGGDDGIAVAYILAILDSDEISHPRIEAVITTDEEIGMLGAAAIDISMLKARRMMNIDSEDETSILTSCAGGVRVDCNLPLSRVVKSGDVYKVTVGGLQGGHSGTEINKERGNAIKILGRVLYNALKTQSMNIISIQGGEADNAIAVECSATVMVSDGAGFETTIKELSDAISNEYKTKEKNIKLSCNKLENNESCMDYDSTARVCNFLMLMPNGVQANSIDIPGLVETSLNVGIVKTTDDTFTASSAVRSSIASAKENLVNQLDILSKTYGGSIQTYGDYPGWQYNPDSKLRATMVDVYREMFGKEVIVEAIHAGLECGIMISKLPGLDCVSFGPNIYDIHTTSEKLSISSTERMWRYILEILKRG